LAGERTFGCWDRKIDRKGEYQPLMNQDPFKLSLSNFLAAGESNDPLQAPPSFTNWVRESAWAGELYEPELLSTADARTTISYDGKPHSVINLCSSPRGRPHREVSFRRRRYSLSFMISLKSITGRISIGPSPYLKPGCCETS